MARAILRCLLTPLMLLGVPIALAAAPTPSLELKLDQPQDLPAAGPDFRVEGEFLPGPDGLPALGLGRELGPAIPAAPFCGPAGTIAFTLCLAEPAPENQMHNRHVVTLRLAGRGFFGFYFIQTSRTLYMTYKDLGESTAVASGEQLQVGRPYRLAATWDGTTVCFYLNGQLAGTMAQGFPAVWSDESRIKLGPYQDPSAPLEPWGGNDVFVRDLKIWKEALNPMAIAADAGIDAVSADARYPTFLAVPRTAAPTLDGKLDDAAWQQAASFVSLLDAVTPARPLSYPDNRPLLCHDGESLYVGFETVFPDGARLLPGQKRDGAETDVWPDESFEFYVDVEGRLFRFAGNAAGGYCEMLETDTAWDGPWEYASTLEFRIEGRYHWQGEIRVPLATLGIGQPAGQDLRINFCRTWRCLQEVGLTSLQAASENYGDRANFATIRLTDAADGVVFAGSTDPSFGDFAQQLAVHSQRGGQFTYALSAVNASGEGPLLVEKRLSLAPGERVEVPIATAIRTTAAESLLFQVSGPDGEPLLRQLVPFRLSEDYLAVTPVFGAGQVELRPRYSLLKGKNPGLSPVARLIGPDGRVMHQVAVISDETLSLPFDRQSPPGVYEADLVSGQDATLEVLSARKFEYTGMGPWEELPPPDTVPPPFTPLTARSSGRQLTISVWGRTYRFARSLLPTAIQGQGRALLSAPAQLTIGGVAVKPQQNELASSSGMRAELAARAATADYALTQEAWLEYDGVFYNRVVLRAERDLGPVMLSLPMPREAAQFLHATASGFGGGGRQNLWLDQDQELPFYPSVWLGNEEGGLAWFAETNADWRTRDPRPIKVICDGDTTCLQITFADEVAAGTSLTVEFGLLATPVKPLPADYPLNTFGDTYSAHLNLPAPRVPVTYSACASWEGAGFFDLPVGEPEPQVWRWLRDNLTHCEQHRAIFTPYTAAMMIPEEYREAASRIAEWQLAPASHLSYTRDGTTRTWYWTCAASDAGDFFAWKFDQLLDRIPLRGIYLDFGAAYRCNNALHGCHDRYPLLAQRRLYQRLAASFVRHGIEDYVIVVHNSETVQWPTFTHVTHFLNGEGLRQMSSTTFHGGKDLQDTYTRLDFAGEHSSLPFGVTSSIYVPTDPLLPEFGGGSEDQELYRFRMTKAALAGSLVHNTLPSLSRLHHGWFDKLVRIYEAFGVPEAEFLPYWRNQRMVTVLDGKEVYVSLYRSHTRPEVLAVVAHMSPEHLDQDVRVQFDPGALGLREWTGAQEMLTAPDPEYQRLYAETNRIRMPIELGDFGVGDVHLEGEVVSLRLEFHSVAIIKLAGRR